MGCRCRLAWALCCQASAVSKRLVAVGFGVELDLTVRAQCDGERVLLEEAELRPLYEDALMRFVGSHACVEDPAGHIHGVSVHKTHHRTNEGVHQQVQQLKQLVHPATKGRHAHERDQVENAERQKARDAWQR